MTEVTRREAMGVIGTAVVGATAAGAETAAARPSAVPARRLRQSVCRWCYRDAPLPTFLEQVRHLGLSAVDLLEEDEWAVAADHGLVCSTGYGGAGSVADGLNDPANHDRIARNLERSLPAASRAGVPNLIAFFGSRRGMTDAEGIDNCAAVLTRIAPVAESVGGTVVVELLNSAVDYPDYIGDRTSFGVEVARRGDSPRVKLLYDAYHMQVMEGNVVQTIRQHQQHIAHYHLAGVPGRHELDAHQELNWRAIAQAIADTGFSGYIAHEFLPAHDPMTSLRDAVTCCDV